MKKAPEAFRTISEVAEILETPAHVLRFWESKFYQIRPVKRAGGRRYYRPDDVALINGIRHLLQDQGMTIRGVQRVLQEQGAKHVAALGGPLPMKDPEEVLEGQAISDSDADFEDAADDLTADAVDDAEVLPAPEVAGHDDPVPETAESTARPVYAQPVDAQPENAQAVDAQADEDEKTEAWTLDHAVEDQSYPPPPLVSEQTDDHTIGYDTPDDSADDPVAPVVADTKDPAETDIAALSLTEAEAHPEAILATPTNEEPMTESDEFATPEAVNPTDLDLLERPALPVVGFVTGRDSDDEYTLPSDLPRIARTLRTLPRGELGTRREPLERLGRRIDVLLERMSEASGAGRW